MFSYSIAPMTKGSRRNDAGRLRRVGWADRVVPFAGVCEARFLPLLSP